MSTVLVILLNGLWQGAAVAALTWCALRLSPKVNASTRYAAWTLALVATVILPIATSVGRVTYEPQYEHAYPNAASYYAHVPAAREPAISFTHAAPSLRIAPPWLLTGALFALWALAAAAMIVRLIVALLHLERLKRDALPLGMDYRERLEQWNAHGGHDRGVRICVTDGIEVPVAVGLFDAMVLLPKHLLETLDPSEIDQVSLHELAHLLRHDDWTNGFQRLITALLFFNPAVWMIARQMDIEREVACDDYVLELTGAVRTYAYCLTKMAEMTSWPHQPLAAPGVFITRKNISIRIERLLRTGRAISSTISPATAIGVVLGLIAAYGIARAVTPVVAFALPAVAPAVLAQASPAPAPKPHVRVAVTVPQIDIPAVHVPAIDVPAIHVPARPIVAVVTPAAHGQCTVCDFSNANLAGRDFSGQNLSTSDFDSANLHGARFDRSNLSAVNFSNADLRDASFVGANLSGCDFEGADLKGARFDGARLDGCLVDTKQLAPQQTRFFLAGCVVCDLAEANLRGLDLRNLKISGIDLDGASLRGANLSGATFTGVNFANADFTDAVLNGTTFKECDFSGADLRGVDLSRANFSGSSLSDAKMSH